MAHHTTVERVLCVDTLHAPEVSGNFSRTLSESHEAIIEEGSGVSICRVRIHKPCRIEREGEVGGRERDEVSGKLNNYSLTCQTHLHVHQIRASCIVQRMFNVKSDKVYRCHVTQFRRWLVIPFPTPGASWHSSNRQAGGLPLTVQV